MHSALRGKVHQGLPGDHLMVTEVPHFDQLYWRIDMYSIQAILGVSYPNYVKYTSHPSYILVMHHKYTSIPIQYTTSVLQGNFALLTIGWARDEIRVRRSGAWARERRLQQKPQRSSVLYILDTALMNYSWITTCFVVFLYHLGVRGHQKLLRDSPLVMIWKFVSSMQSRHHLAQSAKPSLSKVVFSWFHENFIILLQFHQSIPSFKRHTKCPVFHTCSSAVVEFAAAGAQIITPQSAAWTGSAAFHAWHTWKSPKKGNPFVEWSIMIIG